MKYHFHIFILYITLSLVSPRGSGDDNEQLFIRLFQHSTFPNPYTMHLTIDTLEFHVPLDISSESSWINRRSLDDSVVSSISFPITPQTSIPPESQQTTLPIQFENGFTLNNFPFYDLTPTSAPLLPFKATFAIPRQSSSSSTLTLFRNKGFNNVFSIRHFSSGSYELRIGSHSNEVMFNSDRKIECDLLDIGTKWSCKLQLIILGQLNENEHSNNLKVFYIDAKNANITKIEQPFIMDTMQKYIFMPKIAVKFFHKNIFNKLIKDNMCHYVENDSTKGDGINAYYCTQEAIKHVPRINFVINSAVLSMDSEFLFRKVGNGGDDNEYMFVIINSDKFDKWTFGNIIYEKATVIFDAHDNKMIMLDEQDYIVKKIRLIGEYAGISEIGKEDLIEEDITSYEVAFIAILLSNVVGIGLLLVSLFKQKVFIDTEKIEIVK